MDGRIFFTSDRQLSAVRTQDLPELTRAICGYERGLVYVERCIKHHVGYVRFYAPHFEVFVLSSDWAKILPLLGDGWFTPFVVAPQPILTTSPCVGVGWAGKELGNLEIWDAPFYQKVYAVLRTVFTHSYPTSKL